MNQDSSRYRPKTPATILRFVKSLNGKTTAWEDYLFYFYIPHDQASNRAILQATKFQTLSTVMYEHSLIAKTWDQNEQPHFFPLSLSYQQTSGINPKSHVPLLLIITSNCVPWYLITRRTHTWLIQPKYAHSHAFQTCYWFVRRWYSRRISSFQVFALPGLFTSYL